MTFKSREELIQSFPENAICAEIGVWHGWFSWEILKTKPQKYYMIDCWEKQTGDYEGDPTNDSDFEQIYKNVCEAFGKRENVEIIKGYSYGISKSFKDGYFDWIYLDASHYRVDIQRDLEAWYPKIKNGGFFAGHDYIDDPQYPWIEVIPAVDEFVHKYGLTLTLTTEDKPFISWCVEKK